MEATERSVSNEAGQWPTDDEKRILGILTKAKVRGERHMTKARIVQEMGAHGHAVNGIWKTVDRLCKTRQVVERTDPSLKETVYHLREAEDLTCRSCGFVAVSHQGLEVHKGHKHAKESASEFYAPKPKESSVLEQKHDKGHRGKTAEKHEKIKNLYEAGKSYEEMAEGLGIPRGTVASTLYRMIKDGVVKRRNRALGVTASKEEKVEVELQDSEDDVEDDEPEVHRVLHPDVAEVLEAWERFADRIRKTGWAVEVQVKLSYPTAVNKGAS